MCVWRRFQVGITKPKVRLGWVRRKRFLYKFTRVEIRQDFKSLG